MKQKYTGNIMADMMDEYYDNLPEEGRKWCTSCGEWLPESEDGLCHGCRQDRDDPCVHLAMGEEEEVK